jgi:hypothetical protein
METTTETTVTPPHLVQYRAALDLILGSAIRGEKLTLDLAYKFIDAMNLATSEAYGRGYESARDIYKTY